MLTFLKKVKSEKSNEMKKRKKEFEEYLTKIISFKFFSLLPSTLICFEELSSLFCHLIVFLKIHRL